jgi:hypothetical protein
MRITRIVSNIKKSAKLNLSGRCYFRNGFANKDLIELEIAQTSPKVVNSFLLIRSPRVEIGGCSG